MNGKYDDGTRCCDVDIYSMDWRKEWPKLADVQKEALKVVLREGDSMMRLVVKFVSGDVLYFPRNWFHDVRILPEDNIHPKSGRIGLSVSVNVFSTWWPRYAAEEVPSSCFDNQLLLVFRWCDRPYGVSITLVGTRRTTVYVIAPFERSHHLLLVFVE